MTDPNMGPTGGIVPPYIHDAIQDAAHRVARGDTLETIDGTLVHAVVGHVVLDFAPASGMVLLSIDYSAESQTVATVALNQAEVRALAHALACSVWPYGDPPSLLDVDATPRPRHQGR